jgi:hypothetical protein
MYRITFYCILSFYITFYPAAQDPRGDQTTQYDMPAESGEKIQLFTDRSLYCVNEKILFSANYIYDYGIAFLDWSTVLYVELIRWNGEKLAQGKFPLDKNGSSGYLEINKDVITGNYYLRAYTKWMRNYSPYEYAYVPLKIINPFETKTDVGPPDEDTLQKVFLHNLNSRTRDILCSTSGKKYKKRQKAELELTTRNVDPNHTYNVCITIARLGSIDTTTATVKQDESNKNPAPKKIEYLPEIRGISVSGKVINKDNRKPLEKVTVNLTTPVSGLYYSGYTTSREGKFLFTFPYMQGKHDFYIGLTKADTIEAEILIDNDFCDAPVILPFIPFEQNNLGKKLAREIMINMQMNQKYLSDVVYSDNNEKDNEEQTAFYGSAQRIIYTKDYIELPNLQEFFFELMPEVTVTYSKNKPYLVINKPTSLTSYPPLILIDNIPVDNIEQLLKIPTNRIERIELINQGYTKGNMLFNGLISIYSKNNDLAGIELAANSMFFSYNLYSDERCYPADYGENLQNSRIPDRRNCLYWQPDFRLTAGKKSTISFYTSDSKGDYIVYVRSKNSKGETEIYGTCFFSVD